jgi:hypothetical protein
LFLAPAISAQQHAPRQSRARELPPVARTYDQPLAAAQPGSDKTKGYGRVSVRPASVDPKTYRREKAAAEYGPAPTGAQIVAEPDSGSAQSAAASEAPSVTLSFNGLARPGAVNHGFASDPPDTIVAKSPNRVLEGVNSALRLFNSSGSVIQTQDLNSFFGAGAPNPDTGARLLFDPKVFYDRNSLAPRLFVVALQKDGLDDSNPSNDFSRIWVAVSRSPDPSSLASSDWCRYPIEGRRQIGQSNVSWADYPEIGVGKDSFSFATNQFRFTDRGFTFATIRVWNKGLAENNANSCPSVPRFTFQPAGFAAGDFSQFTIQPAQSYTSPSSFPGTTNPAYYMSTTRGASNQYHVYRVANLASGNPTLTSLTLTGASYSFPPSSPQPSTSIRIDTGDNRMLQVAGIGNTLVGTFTTGCNFTSGTPNESCTFTPRVSVGQNSSGGLTASLSENTLSGLGDNIFVAYPSIATNTSLQSASSWQSSGANQSLRSTALTKNVNAGWTNVSAYAPGSCSLPVSDTTTARAGDYSGAQLDPSDLTGFWLAGERALAFGSDCPWQTRIAKLLP